MPFANLFGSSTKASANEQNHDDETPSSTPPGAQTPHPPDVLPDKRNPSLFSGYFGQVRDSSTFSTQSKVESRSMAKHEQKEQRRPPHTGHTSQYFQHGYPTPPTSSASTPHPPPDAQDGDAGDLPQRVGSSAQQDTSRIKPPPLDHLLSSRRNTLTSAPLTSITTTHTVHAPHISNPGLHISSTKPSSPFTSRHSASKPPPASLATTSGSEELTRSATHQSTPPRTPRSPSSTVASRGESPHTSPSRSKDSSRSRRKDSLRKVVSGETKGRLSITISAGRGLKPSVDPYVVCSFQWSEYISKGPQGEQTSENARGPNSLRSMPIRRSASDMGRSMGVPMKSRQSSHASTTSRDSNPSNGQEVTDPVWDHEATL